MNKLFGCVRVVYNDVLKARKIAYANNDPYPSTEVLSKALTAVKKTEERAWLQEVSAVALQQSFRDATTAYHNYFESLKGERAGAKVGLPRYKEKKDHRESARFTRNARFKTRVVNKKRAFITLPGIPGELRIAYSRPLPSQPTSVTLIRKPNGWLYVSYAVTVPDPIKYADNGRHSGIDLGLIDLVTVVQSNGTDSNRFKTPAPKFYRRAERKIKRQQKDYSRKQKGSKNQEKARIRLAGTYRRVTDSRLDHAYKVVVPLVRDNQTINVENPTVSDMIQKASNTPQGRGKKKSFYDAGWGQLARLLKVKAEDHGRKVTPVNPAYTTQRCCVCETICGPTNQSVRVWQCSSCGVWLDRDYNAATNVWVAEGCTETIINACGEGLPRLLEVLAGPENLDEAGTTKGNVPPFLA